MIYIILGEGKVPTDYMRDKNFDAKAFPTLHPTGRFGLHEERSQKLSATFYFTQRLLNKDQRFAKSITYIFMAMQYLERMALESQISVSAQRGTYNNSNIMQLSDPYSVFQKIKGTPKYWKQVMHIVHQEDIGNLNGNVNVLIQMHY